MLTDFNDAFGPDLPDALRSPNEASVWTRAREDYQAGESASTVCERYGLTRSLFFKRAKEEGWRKADTASERAAPNPYVAEMEAALVFDLMQRDLTSAYELARRAWALAEVALLRRRRLEAQGWVRVARDLRKLAMEEAGAITWRRAKQLCEEEAAAKPTAPVAPHEDTAFEAANHEGSSPPTCSGGGEYAGDDANEADLACASPAPPPPPQERLPSTAGAGEEKRTARDYGQLPMSILSSPKKLRAFVKEEFGWPRAAVDSEDRSSRTADSPPHPPHSNGEVAAPESGLWPAGG